MGTQATVEFADGKQKFGELQSNLVWLRKSDLKKRDFTQCDPEEESNCEAPFSIVASVFHWGFCV